MLELQDDGASPQQPYRGCGTCLHTYFNTQGHVVAQHALKNAAGIGAGSQNDTARFEQTSLKVGDPLEHSFKQLCQLRGQGNPAKFM